MRGIRARDFQFCSSWSWSWPAYRPLQTGKERFIPRTEAHLAVALIEDTAQADAVRRPATTVRSRFPRREERPPDAGEPPAAQEKSAVSATGWSGRTREPERPPLGAHDSVAGGVHTAPERGGSAPTSSRSSPSRTPAGRGRRSRKRMPGRSAKRASAPACVSRPSMRLPHQPRLRERDGPHPIPLRAGGRGVARRHAGVPYLVMIRVRAATIRGGRIARIASAIRCSGSSRRG